MLDRWMQVDRSIVSDMPAVGLSLVRFLKKQVDSGVCVCVWLWCLQSCGACAVSCVWCGVLPLGPACRSSTSVERWKPG